MIKKLLLSILILSIIFMLLIFKMPSIALQIENALGLAGLSQFMLSFKGTYDETVTKIPTKVELDNAYNIVQSGALDFKDKFEDGLSITKDKIDSFRETASGLENTYNDLKDGYHQTKDFIDTNSGKIDDIKEVIETITK